MPHIHELYDFTVSGYVVRDNKILLQHHVKLNTWMQPGGHIELNEDPEQALWREIEEETGLKRSDLDLIELVKDKPNTRDDVKALPMPFDLNVHYYSNTHKHIDFSYLFRAKTDTLRLEEGKALGIGWFTRTQLDEMLNKGELFQNTYNRAVFALEHISQK